MHCKIRLWWKERKEKIAIFFAWHMPVGLAKWVLVRAACKAADQSKNPYPDKITYPDMYKALESKHAES